MKIDLRTKILYIFLLLCSSSIIGQNYLKLFEDSLPSKLVYWNSLADIQKLNTKDRQELIETQLEIFKKDCSHHHHENEELVWVTHTQPLSSKKTGTAVTHSSPCTNIDFEEGTMNGWVRSTGFNPLYNAGGCCPTANGDQTIMTGGLDPYGGFPRVYPGGGAFSLRLGSTAVGGRADRISQTFSVNASNANFTYRYALVLNDGGHTTAQQPRFTSEIINAGNMPVPCTFYQASAGSNTFGLVSSTLGAPGNNSPVSYKNWTDVALDLTPLIGQIVTLQFTVYDCGPSGHFAYAYIDGVCTNFETSIADTTCPNVPITMCAPVGFSTTTWNGPGVVNDPNRCINVSQPGTYTCQTLLVPGCPGPTFTHTLTTLSPPLLSFTPTTTSPCSAQYTFNSSMSIASGTIVSFQWFFGDGNTSLATNPQHTYATSGTYNVKLRATSNRGCVDSVIVPITVFPFPNLSFSPPSNCVNTVIQFTNTSTIGVGSITSYTWDFFGNGPNTNIQHPTNTYATNGTYSITLSATSNQGCISALTRTLGIFPPPIISFTANNLCDANGTAFTPATSTAIASGSLSTFFWDFGDGGTSTQASPTHTYTSPGTYTINFSAVSNHNCSAATSNSFLISPSPSVAFVTTSVNACSPDFTFTNGSSISAGTYTTTWSFGGTNTTSVLSPTYSFPSIGNYTVSLVGISDMGCVDTQTQAISIYPYPVISLSVPVSCENAVFSVTTTAVSGSVTSYDWNFGDPGSGASNTSTLQNPTHFYSGTGNYSITLNLISNLNCPSTTITPVIVYPNPTASLNLSTLNNCSLPYNYSGLASSVPTIGASSITKYNWFLGSSTSSLSNGLHNFPSNGSYSVGLIVTTNHNCSDTVSSTIMVHPLPSLGFSVNAECLNLPLTFTSTSSISAIPSATASIASYTWNYGDNTFGNTLISPPHTYPSAQIYTVTLSATSNMSCMASVSKTVEVFPLPISDFTISGNPCFGNQTQFTSSNSISSGTIFSYKWDFGDGSQLSSINATKNYTTSGTYPVTFSTTSNNECLTVVTKTVTIHPLPSISFSVNNGCLNTTSQFNTTSTISVGSVSSYTWNFNDGNSSFIQNPPHTYSTHGTYSPTLTATSNQNCVNTATGVVTIHPLPNIAFSPSSGCEGSVIQFTNSSLIATGSINSYTWNFGNTNTSNAIAPTQTYSYSALNQGLYTLTLSASSDQNCVTTKTNNLNIYPYPQVSITPVNNSCINDVITFTPNITIPFGTINSYIWTFGDGVTSPVVVNSPTITTPAPHTYTAFNTQYTITLAAFSNFNCTAIGSNTVQVYPKPIPNFALTKFCLGDSLICANTSSIAATYSIDSHYWDFFDGANGFSTNQNTKYKYTTPGSHTVALTQISNPELGLFCSATSQRTIEIHPLPQPSFISNKVCAGSITSFSNTSAITITTSPSTNSIIAWSWEFLNDGTVYSINPHNNQFTYPAAGTYTTKLTARSNYNCLNSITDTVRVYANPTPSFVANSACLGSATNFTNLSTFGSGSSSTYTWIISLLDVNTNPNYSYNFTNPGIYPVELTAISNLGCRAMFNSTVSVFDMPITSFSANNACVNQITNFSNLSSITVGNINKWRWDFENDGIWDDSTNFSPNKTYAANGTYTVRLQSISNNLCLSEITNSLIIHSSPTADFIHPNICETDNVSFTSISSTPDGAITNYRWDFNNDFAMDRTEANPKFSFPAAGSYTSVLGITNQFGCTDTVMKTLLVSPKAVPLFSSNKTSGCSNMCINFENKSYISTGSVTTFQWDFGDGGQRVNDIQKPSYCYKTGSYNVSLVLTTDKSCTSTLSVPGYITIHDSPVAAFEVEPEEVDEESPVINVKTNAQDAAVTRYYFNDGVTYTRENFTHTFRALDGKTKPMLVQIVKNRFGCEDTIYRVLPIKPAFTLYFPNVFTPNGDGKNDRFEPKGVGVIQFKLQIFDRWGHLQFETTSMTDTWDGMPKNASTELIKQDVYVWKAEATDVFSKRHTYTGIVTVMP
jgi:gliding motility-associated-like protein